MRPTTSFALPFLIVLAAQALADETITLCRLNTKWLGGSEARECETLGLFLSNYDIVLVQEILAPPYDGLFPNSDPYRPDRQVALQKWERLDPLPCLLGDAHGNRLPVVKGYLFLWEGTSSGTGIFRMVLGPGLDADG